MTRVRRAAWLAIASALMWTSLLAGGAQAQNFPASASDETTTSLGKFTIQVAPAFQPAVAALIGGGGLVGYTYNPANKFLTSPLLNDPTTTIGLSGVLTSGPGGDTTGVTVGSTNPQTISDSTFALIPAGFEGVSPTRELHTMVSKLNLADGNGNAVLAGTAATVLGTPISPGEVESKSNSGSPGNDFPAKSFFDVFVNVNVNLGGSFGTATLFNPASSPLLINPAADLLALPPKVIYVHGQTNAVPVEFATDNPGFWSKGDLFGWLVVSGHGINFANDGPGGPDTLAFNNAYQQLLLNPMVVINPEPSTLALLGIGGSIVLVYARRPRRSRAA
jgi:hypothetical protein